MNATTWLIIAIVGFSLSGITLIAAIFIFIKLNIPAVIGDLTGKTAAREVQAIRAANESSGHRTGNIGSSSEDEVKKSAMALAHLSKRLDKTADMKTTGEMNRKDSEVPAVNNSEERQTEAFMQAGFTEPLMKQPKTSVLSEDSEMQVYATTVLSGTEELGEQEIVPVNFKVTRSIVMIHTDEVI